MNFERENGNRFVENVCGYRFWSKSIGFPGHIYFYRQRRGKEKEKENGSFLREKGFMGIYLARIARVKCFWKRFSPEAKFKDLD